MTNQIKRYGEESPRYPGRAFSGHVFGSEQEKPTVVEGQRNDAMNEVREKMGVKKMPQRKNHKSMSNQELRQKVEKTFKLEKPKSTFELLKAKGKQK